MNFRDILTDKVKEAFMDLIKQINQMIVDGPIEEVWLAATLTRENQSDLYEALNHFEDTQFETMVYTLIKKVKKCKKSQSLYGQTESFRAFRNVS